MMTVICHATPLINFASVNRLDILKSLFREISIPQAVYSHAQALTGNPGIRLETFEITA